MRLAPTALARFGEMFRRGGRWQGRQVISTDWIRQSWTARTVSPFSGDTYGYGWFITDADGHAVHYARGYGGQLLYVVPALDLTVAITSDPTRPARSTGYVGDLHDFLRDEVIARLTG